MLRTVVGQSDGWTDSLPPDKDVWDSLQLLLSLHTLTGATQSTLRRPEVHTFHRKIGICTAPMGVNNMRAAHVVVKNNTKYKTL